MLDIPEQEMSEVNYQPLSYPLHGPKSIAFLPTSGILQKEVLSSVIQFKYTIILCGNNPNIFRHTSVELLFVITTPLRIGLLGIIYTPLLGTTSESIETSFNVTIFDFLFTMRLIVKLQRLIFVILEPSKAGKNLINGSLCII